MTSEPLQDADLEALFAEACVELTSQWRERLVRRLHAEAEQRDPTAQEAVAAFLIPR
ncbi:hypothetical protein F4561_002191 [Lipingzhangella halophila]|uniref:Uncharacterized protein n=1 Tax=Lipingzhangella halophila TaxID=1783352 RepID=A0A7W7RG46_9ACTN|nr:hypothetical protein [Lipingzhangella halophila]MBB4931371.1 hypothetical protein [Lipingzhangella halophila]